MPPKSGGGAKKGKAAKQVTNKRRRGFADPDLKTSKKQARKDDAKFVAAKFGNFASEARKRGGGDDGDFDGDASSSSDDDDARAALGRKPPKQRAFAFKNFARRVAEVDVDVHRAAGELRAAPLHGSSCFFQEALAQWAELCCGADFSAFSAEASPRAHSLAMLVLHQDEVVEKLLSRLTHEAKHSLEALLACLAALARDLRSDFIPHLSAVTNRLARLCRTGVEREPELLEHVFACLAKILKWMQRQLATDLPRALDLTRQLRRHRSAHVRLFAAQARSPSHWSPYDPVRVVNADY